MGTERLQHRVAQLGAWLFAVGLLTGLWAGVVLTGTIVVPIPRLALAAHINGLLGGLWLIAVAATLEQLRRPEANQSPNLRAIVGRIRPSVEPLLTGAAAHDPAELAAAATRANIRASVRQLRHGSALLERRIEHEGLMIVGAEYCVESGTVEFLPD